MLSKKPARQLIVSRRVFVVVALLSISVRTPPSFSSDKSSWISLLDDLRKGYDEVSKAIDWLLWTQDAMLAMQLGKAPPPSPMSPETFQSLLEEEQSRISGLATPSYECLMPENGPVATTSFDATRGVIRTRVDAFQNCVTEVTDSTNAIRYYKQLEVAFKTQQEMLRQLSNTLWELAEKYPLPMITDMLAFQSIDIESYLAIIRTTNDRLESKRKSAESALAVRRSLIKVAAIEIKNLLIVESIDLKAQAQRIKELENVVKKLQEELVSAAKVRDKAAHHEQRSKALMDAASLDVDETDARLDAAKAKINDLNDAISQLRNNANQPYVCPASRANWADCNEPAHEQFKSSFISHRNELLRRLDRKESALADTHAIINDISKDLETYKNQLLKFTNEYGLAQQHLSIAVARMKKSKDQLTEKVRITEEEKWKSRADVFFEENAKNQQQIASVIDQMDRGI